MNKELQASVTLDIPELSLCIRNDVRLIRSLRVGKNHLFVIRADRVEQYPSLLARLGKKMRDFFSGFENRRSSRAKLSYEEAARLKRDTDYFLASARYPR